MAHRKGFIKIVLVQYTSSITSDSMRQM